MVELPVQGESHEEVAAIVGYPHRGSAYRAVFKAIAEHEAEGIELLRALGERLDYLLAKLWPKIEEGDLKAINASLSISDTRIRVLGFARRPGGSGGPEHLVLYGPTVGNKRQDGSSRPGTGIRPLRFRSLTTPAVLARFAHHTDGCGRRRHDHRLRALGLIGP